MRNGIFTKFQSTSYKILITKFLEKVTLQWKGLADPTLIKGSKWTSSVMGQIKTVCHLIGCNEINTAHLCDFSAKDTELESSQEETSHLRTFYKTHGLLSCRASSLWNPRKDELLQIQRDWRDMTTIGKYIWFWTGYSLKKTLLKQLAKHEWVWGWHSSNISIFISWFSSL